MLPYPTQPGDLDRLIADDHAVIFRLLGAGSVNRRVLVDQVAAAVAMHIDIEESVLGPALADAGRRDEAGTVPVRRRSRRRCRRSWARSPGSDCRATGAVRHAVTVDRSCDAPLEFVEPPMVAARPNTPARDAWYVNAHAYGDAGPPVGVP